MVARVPDAAPNQNGTECRFRQQTGASIARKTGRMERVAIHLADLAEGCEVHLLADKGRQLEDFLQIAGAAKEVLIANQFVQAVGAQASHAAQEIGRSTERGAPERRTALRNDIQRTTCGDRLEIL